MNNFNQQKILIPILIDKKKRKFDLYYFHITLILQCICKMYYQQFIYIIKSI